MLFYRPPVLDKSQFCLEKTVSVFDSLVVVVLSPFSVLWNQTSPIVGAFFIWLLDGVLGSLFCPYHCRTNSRAVGIFISPVSDKLPGIQHLSLTRVSQTPKESVSFSHQCRPNSQGIGVFLSPASAELPRSRYLSLTNVSRTPKESASFSQPRQPNSQGVGIFLSPMSAELPRSRRLSLTSVGRTPKESGLSLTSVSRTPKESALSLTTVSRTPKESASFPHQCRTNCQAVGSFLCLVRLML